MLNRNLFRENPDVVRDALKARRQADRLADVDRMIELDERARALTARVDELRSESKSASKAIGQAIQQAKAAGEDAEAASAAAKEQVRALKEELESSEKELAEVDGERERLERTFPNLLHESVPAGDSEDDNTLQHVWGEAPEIAEPKAHDELGEALGILDFKRAAKVSGARFTFVVGEGARLEHALVRFMRDLHSEAGDTEILPPYLVGGGALFGTGQLPKFEKDLFKTWREKEGEDEPQGEPLYLVPTAEVPVTNYHADEILEAADLPRRYFAYSPCFRSEAGSYGKDTRGYIRQHQFQKVEMVRFCAPEDSLDELEKMTDRAEEVLRRLGLHHRRVTLCSADTGFGSWKTHDVEVWLPSQGTFREISSCSTCGDFQARRARIRYRPEPGAKPKFVHTLNGSGLAVGRTLVAILENGQRPDGGIDIPEALRPYFGAAEIAPR